MIEPDSAQFGPLPLTATLGSNSRQQHSWIVYDQELSHKKTASSFHRWPFFYGGMAYLLPSTIYFTAALTSSSLQAAQVPLAGMLLKPPRA